MFLNIKYSRHSHLISFIVIEFHFDRVSTKSITE